MLYRKHGHSSQTMEVEILAEEECSYGCSGEKASIFMKESEAERHEDPLSSTGDTAKGAPPHRDVGKEAWAMLPLLPLLPTMEGMPENPLTGFMVRPEKLAPPFEELEAAEAVGVGGLGPLLTDCLAPRGCMLLMGVTGDVDGTPPLLVKDPLALCGVWGDVTPLPTLLALLVLPVEVEELCAVDMLALRRLTSVCRSFICLESWSKVGLLWETMSQHLSMME